MNEGQPVLRLHVALPRGDEPILVRAKSTTLVSKVLNSIAAQLHVDPHVMRLVAPDGDRMRPEEQLGHYQLQDEDTISLVMEQTGGEKKG